MFRWIVEAEAKIRATPKDVWDLWTDVASWPKWNHALEWSSLEGDFKVGSIGKVKPKEWSISTFQLTVVEEEKRFTTVAKMPLTEIRFTYSVTPCANQMVRIVHHVLARGMMSPLLWITMKPKLQKGVPEGVARLAMMVEERAASKK